MTYKRTTLALLILTVFLVSACASWARTEPSENKTLSPYFLIKGHDPDLDQFPLKSTQAQVKISGVIADVMVTQVYKNEGNKPLEAIYVFPASTRVAVYGMKMTIGERTISARIRKREQARAEYDGARQAGKSASLLELQRPNVFQMNVANILPADVIKVELKYTELLVPTNAVYEFVYPTVVGPRYVEGSVDQARSPETWTANPYLHQGQPPTYTFGISIHISAGLPIQDISCVSHKTSIAYKGSGFATVKLHQIERHGGNRDFILKYRLAGSKVQKGLLLFEGKAENFFLLTLQPPKKIERNQIPPREYIFIVDVSGSMNGFPLSISKKFLKNLLGKLYPKDRFNVLLFAGGSHMIGKKSLPATRRNIKHAIDAIEKQRGGGGTKLLPALTRALNLPKVEGYSRTIVIATDGYVSVEEEAFDLIRNGLGNANIFAFGIGSSVNRHLIEGMARVGMGEPFVITRPDEAPSKAAKFMNLIQYPVLTGISLDFDRFKVYDVEPRHIPDVMADRPIIVFGKWKEKPQGIISIRGITGKLVYEESLDVSKVKPLETNLALRYLWARHRISLLSDYNRLKIRDERVHKVTNLGLTYNLLTPYTSFVAVDTQVRLRDGHSVTVKQPLPLPQGVSDYAVGRKALARKTTSSFGAPLSAGNLKTQVTGKDLKFKEEVRLAFEGESDLSVRKEGRIELGEIRAAGGLSEEAIRRVLEKHLHTLYPCYRWLLGDQLNLKGEALFEVKIDAEGRVINVHMVKNTKEVSRFEGCVIGKLTKLRFPRSKLNKPSLVTVTLKPKHVS